MPQSFCVLRFMRISLHRTIHFDENNIHKHSFPCCSCFISIFSFLFYYLNFLTSDRFVFVCTISLKSKWITDLCDRCRYSNTKFVATLQKLRFRNATQNAKITRQMSLYQIHNWIENREKSEKFGARAIGLDGRTFEKKKNNHRKSRSLTEVITPRHKIKSKKYEKRSYTEYRTN